MLFFGLFVQSYSTLDLLQNAFTESKCLVSNCGYTHLNIQIKKVTKSKKKFKISHVIIILCNHLFIFMKLFWTIRGIILYQINQMGLKSIYSFTTYSKFTYTS